LFLPVRQFTACRFPEGRDHVVSDVSLVSDPVLRVHHQQYPGFFLAVVVVTASVDRIGDPGELAVNRAGDLDVHPGGLVLSRVQFLVPAHDQHGSSVPSRMYWASGSRSSAVGTNSGTDSGMSGV